MAPNVCDACLPAHKAERAARDVEIADDNELRTLSERCGGWIRWEDEAGEVFVPSVEWTALYERWCSR